MKIKCTYSAEWGAIARKVAKTRMRLYEKMRVIGVSWGLRGSALKDITERKDRSAVRRTGE